MELVTAILGISAINNSQICWKKIKFNFLFRYFGIKISTKGNNFRLFYRKGFFSSVNSNMAISLGDRMKQYERDYQHQLKGTRPVIVRLDGHNFSKFTKFLQKPLDVRFHFCMENTCKDLLLYFPDCSTAYTQRDEITLIFSNGLHQFKGRTDKYLSLLAAKTAIRFNHYLAMQPEITENKIGIATFDARIFQVPNLNECLNALLWRSREDNHRNSVNRFCRQFFTEKELFKKHTNDQLQMMLKKGYDYKQNAPLWVQHGRLR